MSKICCCDFVTGCSGHCAAGPPLHGMRPVDIWKSTAAAPAPIRLGACDEPWASRPWQLEQFVMNSFWPAAAPLEPVVEAACAPPLLVTLAYSAATTTSPSSRAA